MLPFPPRLAAISAALLLGGCTALGPDFETPQAPQTEEWLEVSDPKIKGETADYSRWWTIFDDPVLTSLIEWAYQQNLSLQIAGLRILEARARLGIAVGDQYPQVQQAFGSVTAVELSENSPNFSPLIDDSYIDYQLGFDAAWELDFWGRFRRGVQSADASLQASIADYDDFLVTLTAEVARSYATIRTLEERLRLAQANVELQRRSLRIADVRFRNGLVTELDVQQAKSNLADTQALIPALERSLRQAKNGLSILLGIPPADLTEALGGEAPIPAAPVEVAVGLPAELLRRRPDVRGAELQAAAQSARIGIAQADLYPSFSLSGSIGFQTSDTGDSDAGDLFESDSLTGFIGPSFRWNILNYGRIKNNVRAQDARFQQLLVNYENTVLSAYREVEDAVVAFLRTQEEAEFRQQSADAAQRSAELANAQYRDGAVSFQRVVDAERFLVAQQDQLTSSRGDIALNLIAMYKALGGGWQIRDGQDFVSGENKDTMRERTDWGELLSPEELESSDTKKPDW